MKMRIPAFLLVILILASPAMPVWADDASGLTDDASGPTDDASESADVNSDLTDVSAWTCYGPYGGLVRALATSPVYTDDHTILAGTETGGLFISTDSAATWRTVPGLPTGLAISSITVSPNYAEDGNLFISTTSGGVFRSTDRGESWVLLNDGLTTLSVAQMAISPHYAEDQTLVAATNRGIYTSDSAAKTWRPTGPSVTALSVAIHAAPTCSTTIFAGTVIGLYVSRDGGETWDATELNGIPVISIALSPDYASDRSVLLGTMQGAFHSVDGGQTWNDGWQLDRSIRHTSFSPHYGRDNTVLICGDDGLHISHNSGDTWQRIEGIDDAVNMVISPPDSTTPLTLLAGTDHEGVYYSADGGVTWSNRNSGLANLGLDALAVSKDYATDRTILAGGESGVWISLDDGLHWEPTDLTYAKVNVLEYACTETAAQMAYAATNGGIFVSVDNGLTWGAASSGLNVLNVSDIAMGEDSNLWAATLGGGVFYSEDGGTLWRPRSTGIGSAYITSIEWLGMQGEGEWLIAGTTGNGIYVTADGGDHWASAASGPDTPLINALVSATGFADIPVAFAGTTAGAFLSIDRGGTWEYKGLLGLDIQTVALHPNYASRPNCYIGTAEDGIMRSLNGGLRWQALNNGLTAYDVRDLVIATSEANPTLLAATQTGMWRYGSRPQPPTPKPPTYLSLPLVQRYHAYSAPNNTAPAGVEGDAQRDIGPSRRAGSISTTR